MISINVRGIAQDHLPVFRCMLTLEPGVGTLGAGGKQGGTLAVLSCGMVQMQIAFLPELHPYVQEKLLHFYLTII